MINAKTRKQKACLQSAEALASLERDRKGKEESQVQGPSVVSKTRRSSAARKRKLGAVLEEQGIAACETAAIENKVQGRNRHSGPAVMGSSDLRVTTHKRDRHRGISGALERARDKVIGGPAENNVSLDTSGREVDVFFEEKKGKRKVLGHSARKFDIEKGGNAISNHRNADTLDNSTSRHSNNKKVRRDVLDGMVIEGEENLAGRLTRAARFKGLTNPGTAGVAQIVHVKKRKPNRVKGKAEAPITAKGELARAGVPVAPQIEIAETSHVDAPRSDSRLGPSHQTATFDCALETPSEGPLGSPPDVSGVNHVPTQAEPQLSKLIKSRKTKESMGDIRVTKDRASKPESARITRGMKGRGSDPTGLVEPSSASREDPNFAIGTGESVDLSAVPTVVHHVAGPAVVDQAAMRTAVDKEAMPTAVHLTAMPMTAAGTASRELRSRRKGDGVSNLHAAERPRKRFKKEQDKPPAARFREAVSVTTANDATLENRAANGIERVGATDAATSNVLMNSTKPERHGKFSLFTEERNGGGAHRSATEDIQTHINNMEGASGSGPLKETGSRSLVSGHVVKFVEGRVKTRLAKDTSHTDELINGNGQKVHGSRRLKKREKKNVDPGSLLNSEVHVEENGVGSVADKNTSEPSENRLPNDETHICRHAEDSGQLRPGPASRRHEQRNPVQHVDEAASDAAGQSQKPLAEAVGETGVEKSVQLPETDVGCQHIELRHLALKNLQRKTPNMKRQKSKTLMPRDSPSGTIGVLTRGSKVDERKYGGRANGSRNTTVWRRQFQGKGKTGSKRVDSGSLLKNSETLLETCVDSAQGKASGQSSNSLADEQARQCTPVEESGRLAPGPSNEAQTGMGVDRVDLQPMEAETLKAAGRLEHTSDLHNLRSEEKIGVEESVKLAERDGEGEQIDRHYQVQRKLSDEGEHDGVKRSETVAPKSLPVRTMRYVTRGRKGDDQTRIEPEMQSGFQPPLSGNSSHPSESRRKKKSGAVKDTGAASEHTEKVQTRAHLGRPEEGVEKVVGSRDLPTNSEGISEKIRVDSGSASEHTEKVQTRTHFGRSKKVGAKAVGFTDLVTDSEGKAEKNRGDSGSASQLTEKVQTRAHFGRSKEVGAKVVGFTDLPTNSEGISEKIRVDNGSASEHTENVQTRSQLGTSREVGAEVVGFTDLPTHSEGKTEKNRADNGSASEHTENVQTRALLRRSKEGGAKVVGFIDLSTNSESIIEKRRADIGPAREHTEKVQTRAQLERAKVLGVRDVSINPEVQGEKNRVAAVPDKMTSKAGRSGLQDEDTRDPSLLISRELKTTHREQGEARFEGETLESAGSRQNLTELPQGEKSGDVKGTELPTELAERERGNQENDHHDQVLEMVTVEIQVSEEGKNPAKKIGRQAFLRTKAKVTPVKDTSPQGVRKRFLRASRKVMPVNDASVLKSSIGSINVEIEKLSEVAGKGVGMPGKRKQKEQGIGTQDSVQVANKVSPALVDITIEGPELARNTSAGNEGRRGVVTIVKTAIATDLHSPTRNPKLASDDVDVHKVPYQGRSCNGGREDGEKQSEELPAPTRRKLRPRKVGKAKAIHEAGHSISIIENSPALASAQGVGVGVIQSECAEGQASLVDDFVEVQGQLSQVAVSFEDSNMRKASDQGSPCKSDHKGQQKLPMEVPLTADSSTSKEVPEEVNAKDLSLEDGVTTRTVQSERVEVRAEQLNSAAQVTQDASQLQAVLALPSSKAQGVIASGQAPHLKKKVWSRKNYRPGVEFARVTRRRGFSNIDSQGDQNGALAGSLTRQHLEVSAEGVVSTTENGGNSARFEERDDFSIVSRDQGEIEEVLDHDPGQKACITVISTEELVEPRQTPHLEENRPGPKDDVAIMAVEQEKDVEATEAQWLLVPESPRKYAFALKVTEQDEGPMSNSSSLSTPIDNTEAPVQGELKGQLHDQPASSKPNFLSDQEENDLLSNHPHSPDGPFALEHGRSLKLDCGQENVSDSVDAVPNPEVSQSLYPENVCAQDVNCFTKAPRVESHTTLEESEFLIRVESPDQELFAIIPDSDSFPPPVGPVASTSEADPVVILSNADTVATIVESDPVSSIVALDSIASVVESDPVATVVESSPLVSLVELDPVASVVESDPVASVVEAAPLASVDESDPVTSIFESNTVASVVETDPATTVNESHPVASVVESEPVAYIVESDPVAYIVESDSVAITVVSSPAVAILGTDSITRAEGLEPVIAEDNSVADEPNFITPEIVSEPIIAVGKPGAVTAIIGSDSLTTLEKSEPNTIAFKTVSITAVENSSVPLDLVDAENIPEVCEIDLVRVSVISFTENETGSGESLITKAMNCEHGQPAVKVIEDSVLKDDNSTKSPFMQLVSPAEDSVEPVTENVEGFGVTPEKRGIQERTSSAETLRELVNLQKTPSVHGPTSSQERDQSGIPSSEDLSQQLLSAKDSDCAGLQTAFLKPGDSEQNSQEDDSVQRGPEPVSTQHISGIEDCIHGAGFLAESLTEGKEPVTESERGASTQGGACAELVPPEHSQVELTDQKCPVKSPDLIGVEECGTNRSSQEGSRGALDDHDFASEGTEQVVESCSAKSSTIAMDVSGLENLHQTQSTGSDRDEPILTPRDVEPEDRIEVNAEVQNVHVEADSILTQPTQARSNTEELVADVEGVVCEVTEDILHGQEASLVVEMTLKIQPEVQQVQAELQEAKVRALEMQGQVKVVDGTEELPHKPLNGDAECAKEVYSESEERVEVHVADAEQEADAEALHPVDDKITTTSEHNKERVLGLVNVVTSSPNASNSLDPNYDNSVSDGLPISFPNEHMGRPLLSDTPRICQAEAVPELTHTELVPLATEKHIQLAEHAVLTQVDHQDTMQGDVLQAEELSDSQMEPHGKNYAKIQSLRSEDPRSQRNTLKASLSSKKRKGRFGSDVNKDVVGQDGGDRGENPPRVFSQKKGFLLASTSIESGGMRIRPRPLDPDQSIPILVEGLDKDFYEYDGGSFYRWVQQEETKLKKPALDHAAGGIGEGGGSNPLPKTYLVKRRSIFIPLFRKLQDDPETITTNGKRIAQDVTPSTFPRPATYVRHSQSGARTLGHALGLSFSTVPSVYDMDDDDEEWLQGFNETLEKSGQRLLSDDTFEELMELFEREFFRISQITSNSAVLSRSLNEKSGASGHRGKRSDVETSQRHSRTEATRDGVRFSSSLELFEGALSRKEIERRFTVQNGSEDCCICNGGENSKFNPVRRCQICSINVHESCYGICRTEGSEFGHHAGIPNWCCRKCEAVVGGGALPSISCAICCKSGGAMKRTVDPSKWTHVACALYTNETFFVDTEAMEPVDGLAAVEIRVKKQRERCGLCGAREGSCVRCATRRCRAPFHISCGVSQGASFELEHENELVVGVHSFCPRHASFVPGANLDDIQCARSVRAGDPAAEVLPAVSTESSDTLEMRHDEQRNPGEKGFGTEDVMMNVAAWQGSLTKNTKLDRSDSKRYSRRKRTGARLKVTGAGVAQYMGETDPSVHPTAEEKLESEGVSGVTADSASHLALSFENVNHIGKVTRNIDEVVAQGKSVTGDPDTSSPVDRAVSDSVSLELPSLETLDTDLATPQIVTAVYSFWQSKRVKAKGPMLHDLRQHQAARSQGIFNKVVHRSSECLPAVGHDLQARLPITRRPRSLGTRDPGTSRYLELRQQLEILRSIAGNVVRREQLKLEDQKLLYESAQQRLLVAREAPKSRRCLWCESTHNLLNCSSCSNAFCFLCFKHKKGYGVKGWIAASKQVLYVCNFCSALATQETSWLESDTNLLPSTFSEPRGIPVSRVALVPGRLENGLEVRTRPNSGKQVSFLNETIWNGDPPSSPLGSCPSTQDAVAAIAPGHGKMLYTGQSADGQAAHTKSAAPSMIESSRAVHRANQDGVLSSGPNDPAYGEESRVQTDHPQGDGKRVKRRRAKILKKQTETVLRATKRIKKLARSSSFVYGSEDETVSEGDESRIDKKKTVKLSDLRDKGVKKRCTNLLEAGAEGNNTEKRHPPLKFAIRFSAGKLTMKRHGPPQLP